MTVESDRKMLEGLIEAAGRALGSMRGVKVALQMARSLADSIIAAGFRCHENDAKEAISEQAP